ncbi:MAG: cation:proton antiporter [Planctomycetes bacterium]|nr:cation:proton antiporter [Planctomycetota bacterium]
MLAELALSSGLIEDLALVLCVAALVSVLFQKLRMPVVLGYLLAGLLVAPLVGDMETVRSLSEVGVTLLVFSIGLDFSLRKLIKLAPTAGLIVLIEVGLLVWLGYLAAGALGWSPRERMFAGGVVAISSTMVVAKVLAEKRVDKRLSELVMGILVFEDLAAIVLVAVLTAVAGGVGLSSGDMLVGAVELAAFLGVCVVAGLAFVPRFVRSVTALGRKETTLVTCLGLCFALAILARQAGYSMALGAFLAGALAAESGEEKHLERLIEPVRDMFAAVFFVSIGMLIDLGAAREEWPAVLLFTGVVFVGKFCGISVGAFLTGSGVHTAVRASLALVPLGEFSFIIASIAATAPGLGGSKLLPIVVMVALLTSSIAPLLVSKSSSIASRIDRRVPRRMQTFETFYRTWLDDLGRSRHSGSPWGSVRTLVGWILVDTAALGILLVSAAIFQDDVCVEVARITGFAMATAQLAFVGGAAALSTPFLLGILRCSRRLGAAIAERAVPAASEARRELAAPPRRALVACVQLLVFTAVGVTLLALTHPFLPSLPTFGAVVAVLGVLAIVFWRSATDLQGHVSAGAHVLVEVLKSHDDPREDVSLDGMQALLPGMGSFASLRIDDGSPVAGRTLDQLGLRGLTGCAVVAIARHGGGVIAPRGREQLAVGDVLALAGTPEGLEVARRLLSPAARESELLV